jgi:hypothetical protein
LIENRSRLDVDVGGVQILIDLLQRGFAAIGAPTGRFRRCPAEN